MYQLNVARPCDVRTAPLLMYVPGPSPVLDSHPAAAAAAAAWLASYPAMTALMTSRCDEVSSVRRQSTTFPSTPLPPPPPPVPVVQPTVGGSMHVGSEAGFAAALRKLAHHQQHQQTGIIIGVQSAGMILTSQV